MTIEIIGKRPLSFESDHIISRLIQFIEKDICFFEMIQEILFNYSTVEVFDKYFFVENDIKEYKINYSHINDEEFNEFLQLIFELYSMSQTDFKDFRGDFTEYIVNKIGPFKINCRDIYRQREVAFLMNGKKIGQNGNGVQRNFNLDVSFSDRKRYSSIESVNCEAIECKIKLENYISFKENKEPPISPDKMDKIKFMDLLTEVFGKSKSFFVLFATFTRNVEWQEEALIKLGAHRVHIINGDDLLKQLSEVTSN